MNIFTGYITYIAAALMIITGALQLAGVAPDVFQTTVQGWELIMMGLGIFGIGRKVQKVVDKPVK